MESKSKVEKLFDEEDKNEYKASPIFALLLAFKGNTTAHGVPHVTNASGTFVT